MGYCLRKRCKFKKKNSESTAYPLVNQHSYGKPPSLIIGKIHYFNVPFFKLANCESLPGDASIWFCSYLQCMSIWLVVWTPLKNMSSSIGMINPNISGKIIQSCSGKPTNQPSFVSPMGQQQTIHRPPPPQQTHPTRWKIRTNPGWSDVIFPSNPMTIPLKNKNIRNLIENPMKIPWAYENPIDIPSKPHDNPIQNSINKRITAWWYTYPSGMTIPNTWENNPVMFQSPPTSYGSNHY